MGSVFYGRIMNVEGGNTFISFEDAFGVTQEASLPSELILAQFMPISWHFPYLNRRRKCYDVLWISMGLVMPGSVKVQSTS